MLGRKSHQKMGNDKRGRQQQFLYELISGENGILSKKIYYLKPEPPKNSIELIPISYQDFLKWKL